MKSFLERLQDPTPMIFDGGFGSELFARGIRLTNSALANELHPEVVVAIHGDFIEAGADVIETNTFVASPLHLQMAERDAAAAEQLVRLAVRHARQAVERSGRQVYVAGSIGPSPGAIEADSGGVDFGIADKAVREAHQRVVGTLAEEGVDFFCIETMFSAKEAAMAAEAARQTGLPIAVNLTYKYTRDRKSGREIYRTDWGHSAEDLLEILAGGEFSEGVNLLDHVQLLGLNCGAEPERPEHTGMPYAINGVRQLRQAMEERGLEAKRFMAYPNAGLPRLDKDRKTTHYPHAPEEMAAKVGELLGEGAYLIGGCCGTTPAHIRALRAAMDHS
ncbi:MAG: homocysteine S-methyltransferase family protein [Candidatus Latescibacteria bacterium]|nr:homocysteine S-methyltransferase family protein [Candidatus Latescibacterota bacterium]